MNVGDPKENLEFETTVVFRVFLGRGSQSKGSKPEDKSDSQEHFTAAHLGQEELPACPAFVLIVYWRRKTESLEQTLV